MPGDDEDCVDIGTRVLCPEIGPCWDPAGRWREPTRWLWRAPEHINVLEARAAMGVVQKMLEKGNLFGQRLFVFSDSQVTIGALAKGRSSRPLLNYVCTKRRLAPTIPPARSGTLSRPLGETPGGMPRAAPLVLAASRSRPGPTAIPFPPGVRPRPGGTRSRWRPPQGRPLEGLPPPSPTLRERSEALPTLRRPTPLPKAASGASRCPEVNCKARLIFSHGPWLAFTTRACGSRKPPWGMMPARPDESVQQPLSEAVRRAGAG